MIWDFFLKCDLKDESGRWPKTFLMNNFFQTSFVETSDNILLIYEIKYWSHQTWFFWYDRLYAVPCKTYKSTRNYSIYSIYRLLPKNWILLNLISGADVINQHILHLIAIIKKLYLLWAYATTTGPSYSWLVQLS